MAKTKTKKGTRAATAAKRAKVEAPKGTIPLKAICQKLGLDPKASRVKLRRAWRRDEDPAVQFHSKGSRWDLSPKQAKEVEAILRPE